MRAIRFIIFYVVNFFLLTSCLGQAVKSHKLNPESFESKLNVTKEKILVDVRTLEEYTEGHLPNALLIDFLSNDFKMQAGKLDKAKPVFVYCGTGRRSGNAAETLIKMGFKQVYDLDGGINAWEDAGKKIVK